MVEFSNAYVSGHFYGPDGALHSIQLRLAVSPEQGQMVVRTATAYRCATSFEHKPLVIPLSTVRPEPCEFVNCTMETDPEHKSE